MSYLLPNNTENLAARITHKGRKKIAQGDFNISYFQIGDSEFDYGFSMFDGITNSSQKVLRCLDKDSQVKYPYKVSESTLTGTTYGIPQQSSLTDTIKNEIGAAGYVSEYIPFNNISQVGTRVECDSDEVDITALDGTADLVVPDATTFLNTEFITIYMGVLVGVDTVIPADATTLVYRVSGVTISSNTLHLDRNMPNFSGLTGTATIIRNSCDFPYTDVCNEQIVVEGQQDPWTLSTIWSRNPVGLSETDINIDELLSGYTSNAYVSSKEYFGYNLSAGQLSNTSTTITNSFNENIIVPPEEQHSLSILHYTKAGDILTNPWLTFKYEDYIDHTTEGSDYFEIYIPFLYYDRIDGGIGARFFMDTTDYYINSSATDTKINQMKYRYLLDELGNRVGKIFVNHKVVVFDDQEIIAALEYKSNRRYTLPIPRISLVPTDSKCGVGGDMLYPLLTGTTGETVFVTYLLQYTGDTALSGATACNYYCKITGSSVSGDISIKFNDSDFKYLKNDFNYVTSGYCADKFSILVQKVETGEQPTPTDWKIIDFTDQIPNHTVGDLISRDNMRGTRFIITNQDYEDASIYVMGDPDVWDTSTSPEFGDEQPFTGSIKVTRATDVEVMRYLINLPSTDFMTTQNPTYDLTLAPPKRITEVALLDDNKDVMVIAKASSPIVRTGTQVLAVKIDI